MCILDEVAYIKWSPIDMSGVLVDFSKSIILIIITSIVSAIVASKVLKAKITSSHLGKYGVMYVGSHGDAFNYLWVKYEKTATK